MEKSDKKTKAYMENLRPKLTTTPRRKNSFVPGDKVRIRYKGKMTEGSVMAAEYSLDKPTLYKIEISVYGIKIYPTLQENKVFAPKAEDDTIVSD